MLVYDITIDKELHFDYPKGRIIRCVYDHNGVISVLSGMHMKDGVHLFIGSRPNVSVETWANPIHHHITILSKNPEEYAKLFNTKRFVFEYRRHDKESFLKKRFPEWNYIGLSGEKYPMMELVV